MSEQVFGYYKGANVSFVKQLTKQTQRGVYCKCIQSYHKKFVTAENNPQISNAQRISQILSSSSALGGKTFFGNRNARSESKYGTLNAVLAPAIKPIRNKF